MKILQISLSDYLQQGGGSIAMYRLHEGLKRIEVEGKILTICKTIESNESKLISRQPKLEGLIRRTTQKIGLNDLHSLSSFAINKDDFYLWCDIINFHVIHSGVLNYLALPLLTKNKPSVFTLHDMWAFTGHCIYSYDCDRWQIGCGKCPYPDTYPSIQMDQTALEWKLKKWAYTNSNLTIVTPSKWLTEQAKQSMLNRFPIYHIPYGIDTESYQPIDSKQCREILGLPRDKKVIMFGAQGLVDARKGGDILLQALSKLPASLKAETILLMIGNGGDNLAQSTGMDTLHLGYITSDRLKSIAYSAADLFVFPTRADNLPLVLQESMACGTPMVSFNIGGVPDLVRTNITGYLAEPENSDEFSQGIIELLEDDNLRHEMSQNCRNIAIEEYSLSLQAKRYLELYTSLRK